MATELNKLDDVQKKPFDFKKFLKEQSVTILFLVVCLFSSYFSGIAPSSIVREIMTRLARNGFLCRRE